jgi:hypothetical protein
VQESETETSSALTSSHSRCKQLDMGLHRAGKPEQATFYANRAGELILDEEGNREDVFRRAEVAIANERDFLIRIIRIYGL